MLSSSGLSGSEEWRLEMISPRRHEFSATQLQKLKSQNTGTVRDSVLRLRRAFQNTPPLLTVVFNVTGNRKDIDSRVNSAVRWLWCHSGPCNSCFQIVHNTMSTRSLTSNKTCSFRESSHAFSVFVSKVRNRKIGSKNLFQVYILLINLTKLRICCQRSTYCAWRKSQCFGVEH